MLSSMIYHNTCTSYLIYQPMYITLVVLKKPTKSAASHTVAAIVAIFIKNASFNMPLGL